MSQLTSISPSLQLPPPVTLTAGPSPVTGQTPPAVSFGDVVDALNPLQHIPILSGLYRAATGSHISAGSQIVGDTLYGGVMGVASAVTGLASSVANVAVKAATGEDIGQHLAGALGITSAPSTAASLNLPAAVPLAADPPGTVSSIIPTDADTLMKGKVNMAINQIYHANPALVSGEYSRAQSYDKMEQQLVRMAL